MNFQEMIQDVIIGDRILLSGEEVAYISESAEYGLLSSINFKKDLRPADFYLNENWSIQRMTTIKSKGK